MSSALTGGKPAFCPYHFDKTALTSHFTLTPVPPIELSEMKVRGAIPHNNLTPALEAISSLLLHDLDKIISGGWADAQSAHSEIELAPINQKSGAFYRHFLPWRKNLVSLLADSYRRYFKLALAHPDQAGEDLHQWAWDHLQPVVGAALDWLRDWYILACDGENRFVQRIASVEFVPGQTVSISIPTKFLPLPSPKSWRTPAWLFQVAPSLGIMLIRSEHVPVTDSEEKLSAAHTRLLLKGARRTLLWELGAAIKTIRNEEIAAAGAIPIEPANRQTRRYNKRKGWERRIKLYEAVQKTLGR